MTTEDKLHELILKRYHSVREFTITHNIPYSTIHSIFKRGIGNSSVTNIIKICKALNISADALADGEIVSISKRISPTYDDLIEINDILADTKERLIYSGELTLDGVRMDKRGIESIIDALDVGVEIAKKKQKY